MLEASIIAVAFALVAWIFVMRPVVVDPQYGLYVKSLLLGYPAMDLLLLSLLVCLLTAAGPRNVAFRWLIAGVVLLLCGDFAWAFTDVTSYEAGTLVSHLIDSAYLLSYLSWGAATLHPSVRDVSTANAESSAERLGTLRLALLATATLIAPLLLLWQATRRPVALSDAVPIAVGSAVMFLLVIARMALLLRQLHAQSQLLAQQAIALHEIAQRDPLTQLPNRRAWSAALPAALQHSRRSGEPIAVAIMDLDFFKRYNDMYGHPAGDQILQAATAAWSAQLRQVDLLARYGGEEFVLLLPGAAATEAVALVERLRPHTPQEQTFSAGVAVWDGIETADALVQRADQALYAAKSAGRDRVSYASDNLLPDVVSVTQSAHVAA